jgi:osmoprotectant transport system permease protein
VSLAAGIAAAIPLGVWAAKRRLAGAVILGIAAVLQTIPGIALLILLIPIPGMGLGPRPAIVALFLYSLLPIVRNTAAGLVGIPSSLRESAQALGLPPLAALRLVELPLASPSILAGIKTAAVINVGTATLGGLIGAGGYGQLILSGIRRGDDLLLLQGAVPAALLALAIQGLFTLIERRRRLAD